MCYTFLKGDGFLNNLIDYQFLNVYKEVDSFCADVFKCQNGISEYINQMEMTSYSDRNLVPCFESDYKMLKHCRYLRNKIAHDCLTYNLSTQEDFEWITLFKDRLWSCDDPFGIIRQKKEEMRSKSKQLAQNVSAHLSISQNQNSPINKEHRQKQSRGFFARIVMAIKNFFSK